MIDSHIHITDKQYNDDREELLNQAHQEGLETMMVIGCDKKEIQNTINFVKNSKYYGAIGFHPVEWENVTDADLEMLKTQLDSENIVCLGEIGLDYHWFPDKPKEQSELFIKQLQIAKDKDIPISIHARDALNETYDILKKFPGLRGVIHSFSGTGEEALKFVELGFKIGLTGPITFKNGESQKDVARCVSLNDLLIETDGPYLTPVPHRGKRNAPQYVKYVAEEIARQKNITAKEVIEQTTLNFKQLFLGE